VLAFFTGTIIFCGIAKPKPITKSGKSAYFLVCLFLKRYAIIENSDTKKRSVVRVIIGLKLQIIKKASDGKPLKFM
jgi:hypothetical protein